jgi:hypothetical protein
MFGFAVFGCWAKAGDRASGARLVATSAAANKVRSKALGFGLTSLISTLPALKKYIRDGLSVGARITH